MEKGTATERLIVQERVVATAALAFVAGLAWLYTLRGSAAPSPDTGMGMSMAMPMDWSPEHALVTFTMWWVMMVAMMLPSAAPMVLLFSALKRSRGENHNLVVEQSAFVLGYLAIWGVFSLVAVGLQWRLEGLGLISPEMSLVNGLIVAALLIAAGLYQLTPMKRVCLTYCRSPALLLARFWRPGTLGAFSMGLKHGCLCLGCCFFLMSLLFVGGVMNIWWVVGLAVYVAAEKLLPLGGHVRVATGVVLASSGVLLALNELT